MTKTYVISLTDSIERRKFIAAHLAERGVPFSFHDAFDARQLTEFDRHQLVNDRIVDRGFKGGGGSLGCALSHLAVYKRMLREGQNIALVLEDDMEVTETFAKLVEQTAASMTGAAVTLLYYVNPYRRGTKAKIPLRRDTRHVIGEAFASYCPLRPNLHCTGAYLITAEAAEGILRANQPVRFAADIWSQFKQAGAFDSLRVVHPFPAWERRVPSVRTAVVLHASQRPAPFLRPIAELKKLLGRYHRWQKTRVVFVD